MYGYLKIGNVKSVMGKVHEYLFINFDYITKGEVNTDMRKYVKIMIDKFIVKIENPRQYQTRKPTNYFRQTEVSHRTRINRQYLIQLCLEVCYYSKNQDRKFSPRLRFYALILSGTARAECFQATFNPL